MITYKQLSLADIFTDCQNKFDNDKYKFLSLLDETIDLDEIVPASFVSHFHASTGRPRRHLLYPLLKALLLQLIFSIPTVSLLIIFLKYSQELRDFCGFDVLPDASKFTRFKQDFLLDLQSLFDRLVDLTEPICQKIDAEKAAMLLFDTSGIEAWVTENNPKYANSIIKQLKAFKKAKKLDDSYDPYKAAYASMPSHAAPNPAIQQMYINGHFCYVFKFGIITNGLGIVRDITFYNKDFLKAHPEIPVEKKSDSPDEDKSLADSKALIPVLKDFFLKHPLINPKIFLGDAAFDSVEIYKYLLLEAPFEKAYIPLNGRLSLPESGCPLNAEGIPCCPKAPSLPMRREGSKTHLRCGLPTMKFVCPKMKWEYNKQDKSKRRVCHCEDPCTTSSCGRMFYIYPEKDFRAYPGTARGTEEWDSTYKIRVNVEKSINHFKDSFCIAGRKTQNEKTLHADLLLAGITQLITVMVADKINKHQYIRSLKPLAA
ncbi:ISNCY family transposase [Enterocloster clostridioformis]|uniref:transposase n=1 Tax=Enterocloster clostridioformis TaxID=1531 RepID=UPI00156ED2E4|nr:transposase [Enterocloster clostridioformis]MDB2143692.1 transposase [Enterocloster clostridioformis]NSJ13197.1 ISNCY family transposase [Enterocloster clostridioformis]NSJ33920.1 ISNCY family transposase [Enterocloster clostridioformis]NSJ41934.1 ISNCY family transposase [Enterocloster clostridioformis]